MIKNKTKIVKDRITKNINKIDMDFLTPLLSK